MRLETGSWVLDYELLEKLGEGAFGEVWRARHRRLPRVVALKLARGEAGVRALERDGVPQYGLRHPNIVEAHDAVLSHQPPFVILEYVPGKSLRQLLRERTRFEIPDVTTIFRQLLEALDYAHGRRILHGDVKPENILIIEEGLEKTVKLTDFQLGAEAVLGRPTVAADGVRPSLRTVLPAGTIHYIAPEQEAGEPLDARTDLFALGVVLFEMLTGKLPQGRDVPSDVNPAVSWWWDHIFSRCYAGKERRYANAAEVRKDLSAVDKGPEWGRLPSQLARTGSASGRVAAVSALVPPVVVVTPVSPPRGPGGSTSPQGAFVPKVPSAAEEALHAIAAAERALAEARLVGAGEGEIARFEARMDAERRRTLERELAAPRGERVCASTATPAAAPATAPRGSSPPYSRGRSRLGAGGGLVLAFTVLAVVGIGANLVSGVVKGQAERRQRTAAREEVRRQAQQVSREIQPARAVRTPNLNETYSPAPAPSRPACANDACDFEGPCPSLCRDYKAAYDLLRYEGPGPRRAWAERELERIQARARASGYLLCFDADGEVSAIAAR